MLHVSVCRLANVELLTLGTQFTCFIGTKVQILTQKALQGALNELWLKDNPLRTHPFRQGLLPNLRVLLVDMGVQVV